MTFARTQPSTLAPPRFRLVWQWGAVCVQRGTLRYARTNVLQGSVGGWATDPLDTVPRYRIDGSLRRLWPPSQPAKRS